VQRAISKWFPEEKVLELDTTADCLNMLRRAGTQKQRNLFYKNIRPYLLAEEVSFECDGVCKIKNFYLKLCNYRLDGDGCVKNTLNTI